MNIMKTLLYFHKIYIEMSKYGVFVDTSLNPGSMTPCLHVKNGHKARDVSAKNRT